MDIRRLTEEDLGSGIIAALDRNSFFTSLPFSNLWRTVGGTPVYYAAGVEDRLLAIMPGVEFGSRLARRFQAMPNECYSRPLAVTEDVQEYRTACHGLLGAIRHTKYYRAIVTDYYGLFNVAEGASPGLGSASIVDISSPDWLPPDKKLVSEIRKAEREGLAVHQFEPDIDMKPFLGLVATSTRARKRVRRYPDAFFEALALISAADPRVIWLYATHDGHAVASHINIVLGEMLLHWHVYFDRSFSSLKSNQYLLYRAAKIAAERGVRYLNLGATPPEAESLRGYKEKWGGSDYQYNRFEFRSWLGRIT